MKKEKEAVSKGLSLHLPYPGIEEAKEAWPILRQATQGDILDKAVVVKAAYTMAGFGLSLYPGEPGGGFGAVAAVENPADYNRDHMVTDLDNAFAHGADESAPRAAIPWSLILPILLSLLQEWLKK